MISSGARSTVKRPLKKSRGLDDPPALRTFQVNLGVEREHDRGIVGRRIRVREAATERAAVANLRIANVAGAFGDRGTLLRSSAEEATS